MKHLDRFEKREFKIELIRSVSLGATIGLAVASAIIVLCMYIL